VIVADEFLADVKRLSQSLGLRLLRVFDPHAEPRAVAEEAFEARGVVRRGDDEHFANAGEHQRRQRIIDHRLVVDRQQLLAHGQRERMQPCTGTAGEDDALFEVVHSSGGRSGVISH
jgi:hypothetical protein